MSWSYLEPALPLAFATSFLGLVYYRLGSRKRAVWLLGIGLCGAFLLAWPPFAWLLAQPLERSQQSPGRAPSGAQAIVVLAGGVLKREPERPYFLPAYDTFKRTLHAAWVYKNRCQVPVLACGGGPLEQPFAKTMQTLLEEFGVPADKIWIETRSSSTHENALYGARILREHGVSRVLLVEEGICLPRSAACFRKEGITVFPVASEYIPKPSELSDFLPNGKAVQNTANTLHEVFGLIWYRIRGWI